MQKERPQAQTNPALLDSILRLDAVGGASHKGSLVLPTVGASIVSRELPISRRILRVTDAAGSQDSFSRIGGFDRNRKTFCHCRGASKITEERF